MRHAGTSALDQMEELLERLRRIDGLAERSRGVFYRGSRAWLHFHEDPSGLYADVRLEPDSDFVRLPVNTKAERDRLVEQVAGSCAQ